MPNQNDQQKNPVSVISPQADLPPMPPAFQNVTPQSPTSGAPVDESTKGPVSSNLPPVISSNPKKKFGGGRIIATILGILLLVGGVGAGLVLTGQTQLFQQKASTGQCFNDSDCGPNEYCLKLTTGNKCVAKTGGGNCNPSCSGKACGPNQNGCGGDCNPGSGCVYCSDSMKSSCSAVGATCINNTSGGYCTGGCGATQIVCGTTCVNYKTDTNNCGSCGHKCGTSETCQNGTCASASCGPGLTRCGSTGTAADCKNLQTDNNNCGVCGFVCAVAGSPCTNGKCLSSGTINCGGTICVPSDCHCQGGDACTSKLCEPDIHQSCINQGRAWCLNVSGSGMTCCNAQYVCNPNGPGCVPQTGGRTSPPPGTTPPGITASCQNVKAYDSSWVLLSAAQLSQLKVGAKINFCVTGAASGGSFDMAKFTINAAAQAQTTSQRPGSQDFCQAYTIPTGVTSFNITAQIHHTTLGWSN